MAKLLQLRHATFLGYLGVYLQGRIFCNLVAVLLGKPQPVRLQCLLLTRTSNPIAVSIDNFFSTKLQTAHVICTESNNILSTMLRRMSQ